MTNLVYILDFFGVTIKKLMIQIDKVAFGFIDKSYDLIDTFAKTDFITDGIIEKIRINMYVIIGIFALFRMAILLVNSILDPEKLTAKDSGVTKVFFNFLMVFVFLVITPIVFDMGFEVQEKVVEKNFVQRLFINVNELKSKSPGENLKNIAIASLISIDERLVTDGKTNSLCDSKCKEAVEAYNGMVATGFDFSVIDNYIDDEVKGEDGETIYVYDYPILISTVVGGFITYILLSFAIDIAVRVFELAILEVLAPLFIVTYIDPKSAKSGPFSKWLKALGKTYASLFIKLGVLSIMFLFISIISKEALNNESIRGFASIVLIIGILIFAKKAPKWLGGMFGVEGGIGGLSIGKKLKDEMLGGGLATKAARKATNMAGGAAMGAGRMAWNNGKNRRAHRNKKLEEAGYKKGIGKEAREARKNWYKERGKADANALQKYAARRNAVYGDTFKERGKNYGKGALQSGAATVIGLGKGVTAGIQAKDLKGSLKASYDAANKKSTSLGFQDKGIGKTVSSFVREDVPEFFDKAWGTKRERYEEAENLRKNKIVEGWTKDSEKGRNTFTAGSKEGQIPATTGQLKGFIKGFNGGIEINNEDDLFAALYANAREFSVNRGRVSIKGEDGKTVETDGYIFTKEVNGEKITETFANGALNEGFNGYVDPTSSFNLEQRKMFNSFQTDCLNNYTSNQQAYAQEAGVYQNAVGQINNQEAVIQQLSNQISSSEQLIQQLVSGMSDKINLGKNLEISLDKNSLDDMRRSINEGLEKLNKADDETKKDEKFDEILEKFKKMAEQFGVIDTASDKKEKAEDIVTQLTKQREASQENLDAISASQKSLEAVIKAISGNTLAEKSQQLAVAASKIEGDLKAFEEAKKENK